MRQLLNLSFVEIDYVSVIYHSSHKLTFLIEIRPNFKLDSKRNSANSNAHHKETLAKVAARQRTHAFLLCLLWDTRLISITCDLLHSIFCIFYYFHIEFEKKILRDIMQYLIESWESVGFDQPLRITLKALYSCQYSSRIGKRLRTLKRLENCCLIMKFKCV